MKFNVKFPMFSKIEVNGENASPLFKYLEEEAPYVKPRGLKNGSVMNLLDKFSNTKGTNEIRWNFTKFLVDRNGNVVKRFEPVIKMKKIKEEILKLL